MRHLLILPTIALAACAPQVAPIVDYNAPYTGKYSAPVSSPRPEPRPRIPATYIADLPECSALLARGGCVERDTTVVSTPEEPQEPEKPTYPEKPHKPHKPCKRCGPR